MQLAGMHRAVLPVYESASIMWTFHRPGQGVKATGRTGGRICKAAVARVPVDKYVAHYVAAVAKGPKRKK